MLIRLHQSGGFAYLPALAQPVHVDTSTLPSDEAASLESLVSEVEGVHAAPGGVSPAPSGDRRQYVLSIDDGTTRSLTLQDPLTEPAAADLVRRLKGYRGSGG